LRSKIIAWFFVPTAIILIMVAWATFYAYQQVVEDLVIERDRELTRLIASELSREMGKYIELLSAMTRTEARSDVVARNLILEQVGKIVTPRIGRGGHAYLVNDKGEVLYHSDFSRVGDDVSSYPIVAQVLEGQVGAQRTHDSQGREIVASFAPVADSGWGIITEESWEDLIRSSLDYRRSLLLLLVMGVVTPSLVIAIGVRRITRPIAELTSAAQELAGGNFDQTITATTGDELEDLAEQFNRMAAQLQESYRDLERKVAIRTQELAAVNAIAASVNESLDLDETLNRALDELLQLLDLEVGEIRLLDRERNELVIRTQRGLSPEFVRQTDRLQVAETLPGRVLLSGQSIICENILEEAPETWARQEGLQALVICPLAAKDRQLGTLSLGTRRGPRRFNQNQRELLRAVSDQVGVAIENAQLFEVEQRRAEQLQVINKVGQRIASILSVDDLLEEIVSLVQENLGYYLVGIGLIEGDEVVIRRGAGGFWERRDFEPVRLKVGENGIVGWVANHGEPLLVPDVSQESRYYPMPESKATRSELVVPLKTKETVIGVLDVQSRRVNAFDEQDLTVLESLARQAAIAIENARFFKAEQRRAEQFRVISEVSGHITSLLDIEAVLVQVVRLIQKAFHYDHVAIALIEGDYAVYKVGAGHLWEDPDFEFRPAQLKVGEEGFTGWVAGTGEPLLVPNVSQDPRYIWMQNSKTRSELTVPIKAKGEIIGVLDAQSERLDGFDETDLIVMQSLANQAGIAIANARLYEQAQQLAVLEERTRLARDLHDSVTQSLYGVTLFAEAAGRLLAARDTELAREHLHELQQTAQEALQEMRLLIFELRPSILGDNGLAAALQARLEAVEGRAGLETAFQVEGADQRLPPKVEEGLYRIAQEALNNALKHAHARHIAVVLCQNQPIVVLEVTDDGVGFEPSVAHQQGGLGLRGMEERAVQLGARLSIQSQPGAGTRVKVEVPQ